MLLTSEYDFTLQTRAFIASDETVFATHLQIRITLQTSMFIASDERVRVGDEHFNDGDERVENARSSVSDTHTASYQRIPNRIYVEMIAISQLYVDTQQRLWLQ